MRRALSAEKHRVELLGADVSQFFSQSQRAITAHFAIVESDYIAGPAVQHVLRVTAGISQD